MENDNTNKITTTALKRLLTSHAILMAGRYFFDFFMAFYVWKQTNDIRQVALFYVSYLIAHTVAFTIFSGFVKKGKIIFIRRTAILGAILVFLLVFLLKEQTMNFLILLGVALGIFNGMYWISYHIFRFDLTHKVNRGNYAGLESANTTIVSIVMPLLGGFLITINLFGYEYSTVFLLGALLYLVTFFVGNIKIDHITENEPLNMTQTIKEINKNKSLKLNLLTLAFGGLGRRGLIIRLLPILIFDVLQNEFHLGGWLSFFALISILAAVLFGRFVKYKHYRKSILISGSIFFLSLISLAGIPMFVTYIIFSIAKEILSKFISIPKRVVSDNLIHQIDDHARHRVEYVVIREWFSIGFGRTLSYVVLLFIPSLGASQIQMLLIFVSVFVILEIVTLAKIPKKAYSI